MASITENLIEQVVIGESTSQIASTAYGICNSQADTAAKVVEMDGFVAVQGVTVHIKFVNANTALSPTLNVNNTGGLPIMLYGSTHAGTNTYTDGWPAGAVIAFTLVKDGNNWQWFRDYGVNTDTQYTVEQTYNGTSTNPISGAGVKNAIETLDKSNIAGFGADKTLATLTETDGIIDATFQSIQIAEGQVTNLVTDLGSKANLSGATFTGPVILSGTPTNTNEAVTKGYVDSITSTVSSPMHYIGDATVTITPGQNGAPDTITVTNLPPDLPAGYTPQKGDVIADTTTYTEYVYTGDYWRELGDEGSYALKTKTDTAIKAASVSYTAQTLTNNTFSGLTSVETAGTIATLTPQSVTVTGMATEGSVTTAAVTNGTLVITIGTAPTKSAPQTFDAVGSFNGGAMPTFNSGSTTVGITTGGATLSVDTSISVVVP